MRKQHQLCVSLYMCVNGGSVCICEHTLHILCSKTHTHSPVKNLLTVTTFGNGYKTHIDSILMSLLNNGTI